MFFPLIHTLRYPQLSSIGIVLESISRMWRYALLLLSQTRALLAAASTVDPDMQLVNQRLFAQYLGAVTEYQPTAPFDLPVNDDGKSSVLTASGCIETCSITQSYTSSLLANGSWADVDYNDASRTVWKAAVHWERLVTMTRAFNCKACVSDPHQSSVAVVEEAAATYNSTKVLGAIFSGANFWIVNAFKNPNWCIICLFTVTIGSTVVFKL